jgi:putative alpha-1,2-mannosidase
MSAWYVLSSMGLYQVEPAGGRYIIGSPLFDSVEMNVGNGRTFKVTARNNSAENIYVQSAKLNGKKYTKSYVDFKDIVCGGELELVMGSQPSAFGTAKKDRP